MRISLLILKTLTLRPKDIINWKFWQFEILTKLPKNIFFIYNIFNIDLHTLKYNLFFNNTRALSIERVERVNKII